MIFLIERTHPNVVTIRFFALSGSLPPEGSLVCCQGPVISLTPGIWNLGREGEWGLTVQAAVFINRLYFRAILESQKN